MFPPSFRVPPLRHRRGAHRCQCWQRHQRHRPNPGILHRQYKLSFLQVFFFYRSTAAQMSVNFISCRKKLIDYKVGEFCEIIILKIEDNFRIKLFDLQF